MPSGQQTGDGQILVKVRPVDVGTVPKDLKVAALPERPVPQTGIPNQRRRDRAAIHQVNGKAVARHPDGSSASFLYFDDQRIHTSS